MQSEQRFDVFMCHNSEDKSAVIALAERLEEEGLRPWLDEWELQPGLDWSDELDKQIGEIATAAVFVGASGIGPWQDQEIKAFLTEFVERGCPVIPVILKGAQQRPDLPRFLRGKVWVDFRRKRPEPFERLLWGITGENPRKKNGNAGMGAGDVPGTTVVDEPLITSRAIEQADGFEERYLLCQAADVQGLQSLGPVQHPGIFVPLLKDVFVPLELDLGTVAPGFKSVDLDALSFDSVGNVDELDELDSLEFRQSLDIWSFLARKEAEATFRQIAILAWGGYGKTTLLKHVAYCYGSGQQREGVPKLIPFLLMLRKYRGLLAKENTPSLSELIEQQHVKQISGGEALVVPDGWVADVLRSGRGLVMLDGFDEVAAEQRSAVAKWIAAQMRQYSESVFIVTSRPKAYQEQDAASRLVLRSSLWVRKFDAQQRRDFVTSWYACQERYANAGRDTPDVKRRAAEATEDLLAQIEENAALTDLAQNPLLLNMIVTFHRRYRGASLPKRKVELYREICQLQLRDRPRARRLETPLVECDAQAVLQRVAFEMMQREKERVEKGELLELVGVALAGLDEVWEAEVFLDSVVEVSELIVLRDDEYEFAHLSFQEYLAAAHVAAEQERKQVLYERFTTSWWRPTLLFYSGMVNPTWLIEMALEQGAIDLAHECLQGTRKRINEALKAKVVSRKEKARFWKLKEEQLEKLIGQVADARYADLERYLQNEQWQEADNETHRLMIIEIGKEKGAFFSREDLLNFPCEPLKLIDDLWVQHSSGNFGFSVQKEIYLKVGGIANGQYNSVAYNKFCEKNGWKVKDRWVDVKFETDSPRGHLPVRSWCVAGVDRFVGWRRGFLLFFRIQTCGL